ncbi:uncharacterized protein LOC135936870 [Cloeon dipterum]|uniref:uncharacterized protein LOC135936870 n=1 Tax=Cloeon dipterum TaxID=197152 RepID=UPI0032202BEC
MRLQVLTAAFLLLIVSVSCNSRKKRYLIFPTNSFMTLSGCLAKGGIILSPPAFVFTFDFDILFQLPNTTRVWTDVGPSPFKVLRKEKRDIYNGLEDMLQRQGFNGRACVLRAICEARQILGEGGTLMEDVMHAIFSLEAKAGAGFSDDEENEVDQELKDYDDAHVLGISRFACHQLYSECPFSLLHYALW